LTYLEVLQIVKAVCSHYRLDESELMKSRRGRFNEPRAVAIYLIRTMRKDGFADIGSAFGLKSYSAAGGVLSSMRKRLSSDLKLGDRCRRIQSLLLTGQTETWPVIRSTDLVPKSMQLIAGRTALEVYSAVCVGSSPRSLLLASVLFAASIAVSISASGCRFYCRFAQPKSIIVLIN